MPTTPARNIRIPDAEWRIMQAVAQSEGITVSAMVRAAVRQYVKSHTTEEAKP